MQIEDAAYSCIFSYLSPKFSNFIFGYIILGRCEQYTFDSMVYLIGNEVDRWYIFLETMVLGQ